MSRLAAAARLSLPLAVLGLGALLPQCGPSDATETVGFVLDRDVGRVKSIDFKVNASSGNFTKSDGGCDPSNAAAGTNIVIAGASSTARIPVAGVEGVTTTSSSSSTTPSTEEPTTTTLPPTTTTTTTTTTHTTNTTVTTSSTTTTIGSGKPEFDSNSDGGQLTIHISNPNGIPSGSVLAFCRFQGNASDTTFDITTTSCTLANGAPCDLSHPAEVVTVSTTTTTTVTTTTVTLLDNGEACSANRECTSGFCVSEVCCRTECAGACGACILELTGVPDGTCGTCSVNDCVNNVCVLP